MKRLASGAFIQAAPNRLFYTGYLLKVRFGCIGGCDTWMIPKCLINEGMHLVLCQQVGIL